MYLAGVIYYTTYQHKLAKLRCLLEAWEINMCKSPLNRNDGMYRPKGYRALTPLGKT